VVLGNASNECFQFQITISVLLSFIIGNGGEIKLEELALYGVAEKII